ncbi:MAG: hypothetical protein PWR27_2469 [Petroclostridium sp.]|jgi:AraC-like DNA-binding protein|uniref:helix-turn-helix domain-containing protein n=1 Tax=Petroclostridium xylanilyticum TaxID=1792311 RepID=UPI000B988BAB|nr:AraC family transcriptional regulator [Petroclostridium xylanilyticum]MBZ4647267.1 transcriptional regulator with only domain, AraC family [Clostridia bacterium]MDK2811760.1 hypothetical protein [Petroclostridium sp.]
MIIEGLHEKGIFTEDYPFRLTINIEENFDYPFHWHNAVELVYVLENGYKVNVNSGEYHLNEKDILIIAGGDIHGFYTRNNKGRRVFIQFDISMLDGFGDMNAVKPFLSQTKKISFQDDKHLHHALEEQILRIIAEYEKKEFAYALNLNARIYDIIVILSRNLISKISSGNEGGTVKKVCGLEKLSKAFKYIEENYQNNITLKDVSKATGFSEYHFSRIFKEITEKNFHSYLTEFRIKKAEKLLMNTDTTVAQAAHATGFNSIATFNRTFKEIKGCTPTLYRKMCI